MSTGRRGRYRRNERLERLLTEINEILGPAEDQLSESFPRPRYPILLVVGGPRSGSTLMMQWLAASGRLAYPSNLLSRFYRAPSIGARIQLLLTEPRYSFMDELEGFGRAPDFSSDLGKTRGALQPNDFWYFWRRFIPNSEPVYLDGSELAKVDGEGFLRELAAIEAVFDKPFAMKGMILEQNIPFLHSLLDKVLFINIKRHPLFNIQSLLEARTRFFGDRRRWYSIRPRQYEELAGLDPVEQVAGQVYYKNRAIEEGLQLIPASRQIDIGYEEFCNSPLAFFEALGCKLARLGFREMGEYEGPERFECADTIRLSAGECERAAAAYHRFSGMSILQ
jgi:hypothetical protein